MTGKRRIIGAQGEAAAHAYLRCQGCLIVETGFRTRHGEIDIIARDGDTLCFVEVKTRKTPYFGSPAEAVTETKQEHLILAAETYLSTLTDRSYTATRFDVIAVFCPDDHQSEISWYKNAFTADR